MIAAMTLGFLDPFGTGKLVLFQVTYDKVRLLDLGIELIYNYDTTSGLARLRTDLLFNSWCVRSKFKRFSPVVFG